MPIAPNPIEWLLLFLLGGGFSMSPGVPPAEEAPLATKVAPAECLFYASWAATGKPDANSPNQTEQLLAEKEIQKFLVEGQQRMFGFYQQAAARQPDVQQNIQNVTKLLELIRGKAGAMYITDLQIGRFGPSGVNGAALFQLGDQTDEAIELIEKLQNASTPKQNTAVKIDDHTFRRLKYDDEGPSITWGTLDDYLVVGIGDNSIEALIKRSQAEAPEWLTDVRTKLSVPRLSTVTYVDVNRLIKLIMKQDNESDETKKMLTVLGLDKLNSFRAVSGMDEKGCITRAMLSIDGKPTGLFEWIDAKPLTAEDLAPVGSDVLGALAIKLDASQLFDLWLKILDETDPRAAKTMQVQFDGMSAVFGFNFRDDFLKSIGDTWRVFVQPTGPTAVINGWTLAVQVRDRDKLVEINEALTNLLKQQLLAGGEDTPILTTGQRINGEKVFTLDFEPLGAPFAPSWCITDKEFILGATLDTLERYLKATDKKPLAQKPDVAPLVAKDAKTLAMVYIDTRELTETVLPKLPDLIRTMEPNMPVFDTSQLPSLEVFAAHLQPCVFSARRVENGLELVSRQTLPGGNLGAMAPLFVGVTIPARIAAQGAAHRMQGANHLKELNLALLNHEAAQGAYPAGYSADEKGKPLLSWRVYILPYLEQQDLYEQFHLDEPWDSPHNKKLIEKMPDVFYAPSTKPQKRGMTNYLGVSGADGIFVRPEKGGKLGTKIAKVTDGTSNTIMLVEVPDESAVVWTKPGDFAPDKKNPTKGLIGLHPGGFQAGFADGSVHFLSKDIDADIFRALLTKSGGEVVNRNDF